MARGIAIHIGVNQPASNRQCRLSQSEDNAWKMAELSHQAGYRAIHLLCGEEATREAVHGLLSAAANALKPDDTLFVSFSGHGSQVGDANRDERDGLDETWCLYDADLVDDELMDVWRAAKAGRRVLVVSESCFAGGMRYADGAVAEHSAPSRPPVYRSGGPVMRGVKQYAQEVPSSCISRAPLDAEGIEASVLLMAGAGEGQRAREGLYLRHLLKLWNGGAFRGSFCELHRQLCETVRHENPAQEPQIIMLGNADPDFPLQTAFHLDVPAMRTGGAPVMRGGTRG
ncbi:MAG TPA: caspase family protein [Longimicrobium sp.]|jgi:hypothetical protein